MRAAADSSIYQAVVIAPGNCFFFFFFFFWLTDWLTDWLTFPSPQNHAAWLKGWKCQSVAPPLWLRLKYPNNCHKMQHRRSRSQDSYQQWLCWSSEFPSSTTSRSNSFIAKHPGNILNWYGEHCKQYNLPANEQEHRESDSGSPPQCFCLFATYRASQSQHKKEHKHIISK